VKIPQVGNRAAQNPIELIPARPIQIIGELKVVLSPLWGNVLHSRLTAKLESIVRRKFLSSRRACRLVTWPPLTLPASPTSPSHAFAGQKARLLHPSGKVDKDSHPSERLPRQSENYLIRASISCEGESLLCLPSHSCSFSGLLSAVGFWPFAENLARTFTTSIYSNAF
jgi:hypothetical protein